ncbi:MAG: GH39 family glycosyl hydrolase [Anaerorhabdus sp.]
MEFNIDIKNSKWQKSKQGWKFCVGSGNAKLALQSDYQSQLKFVRDELGIERVRFHGLFNDGLYVVREINDIFGVGISTPHIREYSFQQVGKVLDAVIECGMQPFIELGMMPKALARDDKTIFQYKDYISPPKQMEEWNELIERFLNFIINRYGLDVVKEWYFEVWNEPDISNFWSGTKEEYFELYKNTAETLKKVCKDLKVGGPSTAKSRWVDEFYDYCQTNNVPVDFMSTHQYPGDALGHSFSKEKHMEKMKKVLAKQSDSILEVSREILCNEEKILSYPSNIFLDNAKIAKQNAKEYPLFYTEWNTTSVCVARQNDSVMSAAYIVKTSLEVDDVIDGSSFWTFSDIFEELGYFTDPFNGSFGLLTIDGIEKPSFYGFKFLNQLGKEKMMLKQGEDHIHVSLHRSENQLQLIMTNHHFDMDSQGKESYQFLLDGLNSVVSVSEEVIGETKCNAVQIWKEMGSPKPLKRDEIETIRQKAKPIKEAITFNLENERLSFSGELQCNETKLITINLK